MAKAKTLKEAQAATEIPLTGATHAEVQSKFYLSPEKACANLKSHSDKKYKECIAHAKETQEEK